MFRQTLNIWGKKNIDSFDYPEFFENVHVKQHHCSIPDTFIWTSDVDNSNVYCFPKLHTPTWVNTSIDLETNREYVSQVTFTETYWGDDFECFHFNNNENIISAFVTQENGNQRCKINYDQNTLLVDNLDWGRSSYRFYTGFEVGNYSEKLSELLFDDEHLNEPYVIVKDIIDKNNLLLENNFNPSPSSILIPN